MATLASLGRVLERERKRVERNASERVKAAALAMVESLGKTTPVDTSEAVSNWVVGTPNRDTSLLAPHFPGHHGSTRAASVAEMLAYARAILRDKKPGEPVFISNAAGHIRYLDEGTARMPAHNMVARAMIVGRATLKRKR